MTNQNPNLLQFNRRMDELVENVIRQDLLTSEFRAEYVKTVNLCRKVAEYDTPLAWEVFFSTIMFSYYFASGSVQRSL